MPNEPKNGQIMMTYRCSAACRHCLVMAAPTQGAALLSVGHAVEYARDFHTLGRCVIIAGGEALLFFDHVVAMCRGIREAGIPIGFIESNGSWCTTDELVRERLSLLQSVGVEGMYFSIDGYHQEFVPAERVCRGVRIARELFGDENVYAPRRTLEEVRELETVTCDAERLRQYARSHRVAYFGRAADALAPMVDQVPVEDLQEEDCQDELDVDSLAEIQVDPFGFVRPDMCPGVNLGNTRQERLADLARTERVRRTPLLRRIAEHGPAALLPLARDCGFGLRASYASKCHLCFDIRRRLVHRMPDAFGPPRLYRICP
jgi:hypothetical protein